MDIKFFPDVISIKEFKNKECVDGLVVFHSKNGVDRVYILSNKERMEKVLMCIKECPEGRTIEEVKEVGGIVTIGSTEFIDITLLAVAQEI